MLTFFCYLRFISGQESHSPGVLENLLPVSQRSPVDDLKVVVDEEGAEFTGGAEIQQAELYRGGKT